jgi:ribokinase
MTRATSSQPTIVVVGGANYDYLAKAPKLPKPGETVQGDLVDDAPGGKGANQAVAAARLGASVAFIGRVGRDDRADRLLAAFAREQIDVSHLIQDRDAPTGVALVQVDRSGEKQILAVPGANSRMRIEDLRPCGSVITHARVLMLQLELPLEVVCAAAQLAHDAGVTVVLDPAPPVGKLPDHLLGMVDVIKPNAAEAHALTGIEVKDRASARDAAKQLLTNGVRVVAVTAGDAGTLVVSSEGEWWLPRLPVKSVDATGAGDAFAAAFAVACAEGKSPLEAGQFANAAAALATTTIGAQASMPTRHAVLAELRRADGG